MNNKEKNTVKLSVKPIKSLFFIDIYVRKYYSM